MVVKPYHVCAVATSVDEESSESSFSQGHQSRGSSFNNEVQLAGDDPGKAGKKKSKKEKEKDKGGLFKGLGHMFR